MHEAPPAEDPYRLCVDCGHQQMSHADGCMVPGCKCDTPGHDADYTEIIHARAETVMALAWVDLRCATCMHGRDMHDERFGMRCALHSCPCASYRARGDLGSGPALRPVSAVIPEVLIQKWTPASTKRKKKEEPDPLAGLLKPIDENKDWVEPPAHRWYPRPYRPGPIPRTRKEWRVCCICRVLFVARLRDHNTVTCLAPHCVHENFRNLQRKHAKTPKCKNRMKAWNKANKDRLNKRARERRRESEQIRRRESEYRRSTAGRAAQHKHQQKPKTKAYQADYHRKLYRKLRVMRRMIEEEMCIIPVRRSGHPRIYPN